MPENDWWIPLTFSYIGAMKIIHSVIYGSNYQNTCNHESIHVRKRIFDHFSRFRLSTLIEDLTIILVPNCIIDCFQQLYSGWQICFFLFWTILCILWPFGSVNTKFKQIKMCQSTKRNSCDVSKG